MSFPRRRTAAFRWAVIFLLFGSAGFGQENEPDIAQLISGLSSTSSRVRWHSARRLGATGERGEAAIPRLIELVNVPPEEPRSEYRYAEMTIRHAAVWSLGEIARDPDTVIPVLQSLLDDADSDMRLAAAYALAGFGEEAESAIPRLVESLNDPPDEMIQCATCGIGPRHWAGTALVRIGSASVPQLIEALESEQLVSRRFAADTLRFFGDDSLQAIPTLVEATRSDDAELRKISIWSLAVLRLRPELTVPALTEALGHQDVETRRSAAYILGLFGPDAADAIPILRGALNDVDEEVRESAAISLNKVSHNESEL